MARTVLLQDVFEQGVKKDVPRDRMPAGSLWGATDMLPNLEAKLRQRGGYMNVSNDIAAVTATAAHVIGGVYAPFEGTPRLIAFDEDGRLYTVADNGVVVDKGASRVVAQNPVFHRDLIVITASGGGTPPQKFDGPTNTIAALGGSPPSAIFATVFADRTVLGKTTVNPNRIWFSGAGNPESYDTTNSYLDFTYPLSGLASMRTAILVFHDDYVSRIRGYTPPSVAGGAGDFAVDDPMWPVGCSDARSIAYWADQIVFANADGIHVTDGAGVDDLTRRCGMKRYWRDTIMSGYTSATWTIVGGVLNDHYIVAVMDGATFKAAAAIDLRGQAWWPLTNIDARAMWSKQGSVDELYFGRRGAARVCSLASIFMPSATVKNDGDGDAVAGAWETPFYRGKPGEKGWRRAFLTHYLADYATDNPTVTAAYVKTPEKTTYTNLTGTLAELTAEDRRTLALGFASDGVAFKFTKANAGDWRISSVEADVNMREQSR